MEYQNTHLDEHKFDDISCSEEKIDVYEREYEKEYESKIDDDTIISIDKISIKTKCMIVFDYKDYYNCDKDYIEISILLNKIHYNSDYQESWDGTFESIQIHSKYGYLQINPNVYQVYIDKIKDMDDIEDYQIYKMYLESNKNIYFNKLWSSFVKDSVLSEYKTLFRKKYPTKKIVSIQYNKSHTNSFFIKTINKQE